MSLKTDWSSTGFETRAIHGGQEPDPSTGAIMTPIFQTSTYVQESPGVFKGYEYSRTSNPTRVALEGNLASIEGGRFARAFASGSAATSAVLACLNPGDHVLCGDDVYGGSFRLMDKVYKRLGLEFSFVDQTDLDAVRAAIRPNTKLCWIETPTNPTLKVVDIAALCTLCNEADIASVVDNTFATPYLQSPLELGATMVAHSTTKYLGGHSDVVGGAIITNDERWMDEIQFILNSHGRQPRPPRLLPDHARDQDLARADGSSLRQRRALRRLSRQPPAGQQNHLPGARQPPATRHRGEPNEPLRRDDQLSHQGWARSRTALP